MLDTLGPLLWNGDFRNQRIRLNFINTIEVFQQYSKCTLLYMFRRPYVSPDLINTSDNNHHLFTTVHLFNNSTKGEIINK